MVMFKSKNSSDIFLEPSINHNCTSLCGISYRNFILWKVAKSDACTLDLGSVTEILIKRLKYQTNKIQ
jgi:hypothetical protein